MIGHYKIESGGGSAEMNNAIGAWPDAYWDSRSMPDFDPRESGFPVSRRGRTFRIDNQTNYPTKQLRKMLDLVFRDYAIPGWLASRRRYRLTIRRHREEQVTVDWTGTEWRIFLPYHFCRSYHYARACYWFATRGRVWIDPLSGESTDIGRALLSLCDKVGQMLFEIPEPNGSSIT